MEKFSAAETSRYYPQWVPDAKNPLGGQVVKTQDDHIAKFPDHYDEWLTKLNPPPKSEEELNGAVMAEREACIKFIESYPTGTIHAKEIAKALRKSRSMGIGNVVPTGTLNKSTKKSNAVTASAHAPTDQEPPPADETEPATE